MAYTLNKDLKTTVLKMVKELKKDVENIKKMMYKQNGNTDKGMENLKILELKSITERNSLEGFKDRFEQAEESVILKIG